MTYYNSNPENFAQMILDMSFGNSVEVAEGLRLEVVEAKNEALEAVYFASGMYNWAVKYLADQRRERAASKSLDDEAETPDA